MSQRFLGMWFLPFLLLSSGAPGDSRPDNLLLVANQMEHSVLLVDPVSKQVLATVGVDINGHEVAVSPDGRRIYTANNEAGSVSVLDLKARTLLATVPISKKVQRITISADGRFVFTQDQQTPRIAVIDTATNAVVRSISFPRIVFSSIITKDGRSLLANSDSGKLFVVDLSSGAVTKTFDTPDVPVLPTPGEFALAPDGIHAYLTCPQGGTIEVLNLRDSTLEEPIRLTKGVDGMAWVPAASN